ncbi:MAG: peptidoglycan DD-metalloendopeptidase family protein [Actinobacteria bacterium]|nr:peptidoglycan DD-metalloendopeptidase family protein [Actinomycetota bacterium]
MMQKRLRKRLAAGILAGAIILTPATVALAEPGTDLQSQLDQINARNSQTRSQLDGNKAQQNTLVKQIADLDQRVVSQTAELNRLTGELNAAAAQKAQIEQQLAALQAELNKTLQDLAAAKEKLRYQQMILGGRVKGVYKNGKKSYYEIVLNSGSFKDLVNRFSFLQFVVAQDAHLVKKVQETKAVIEAKEKEQEQQKSAIQAKQVAMAAEVQRIGQLRGEQESRLASLQAERVQRQGLIDKLKQDQDALLAAQRQEEADANAIVARINAWKASQTAGANSALGSAKSAGGVAPSAPAPAAAPSAGGWVWPTGTQADITSVFGSRSAPTAGASSFHEGIDIAVAEGTPVVAANSGTVIDAGYFGGFGNFILIDNGNGLSSSYAHLSDIAVSPGQSVSAGQVIGSVGSTGVSTGPHLDFRIYVDGAAQNPMNWYGG